MSIKKGNKVIAGAPLEAVWGNISGDITDQADLQAALAEKVGANSPVFTGTPTAPTPPTGSYDDRIATTSYVQRAIESVDALPSQAGHGGQYLTTNGTTASWATVDALPSQSGQSGKYLTTNGTTASWQTIDLSGKVDKVTSTSSKNRFYIITPAGVQSTLEGEQTGQTAATVPIRTSTGTIRTATPTDNNDAVNLSYLNTALSTTVKTNDVIQNMNTHGRAERLWMSEIHDVLYKADSRFTVTGTGFTAFDASRLFNGSFEDYYCKLEAGNTGTIVISGSSITGTYRSGFIFVSFYSNWSPHSADQVAITIENASGNVATLTPEAWETKGSGASSYVTVVRAVVPSLSTANAISKITITITNSGTDDICPSEIEYFLSRPSSIELLPVVTKFGNNRIYGNLTVNSIIKSGGTSAQFLKADGSVDSNTYVKTSDVTSTYSATGTAPVNGTAVASAISSIDPFPTQAGNNGKFLTTDGTYVSWADTPSSLPSQSGQSGKFLTTNGSAASWASLPTYSSGTGITVSGTTINHSNSVTAGTAGTSSATSGSSLAVPYVTYDAQGHITASGTHTHTVTGFLTSNDIDQTYSGTSTNAQSGVAVKSAIDAAVASVYKPAGSVAFANKPTLSSSIEGNVYNITDDFTTTADFVEGTGHNYPAGTNIVCINTASSGQTAVYKWDVLAGFIDLSGYVAKDGGSSQQTIQLTSGTGTTAFGVKSRSTASYISLSGTSGWLGSYGVTSAKEPTFYNGSSYTLAYNIGTGTANGTISANGSDVAVKGLGSAAYTSSSDYQPTLVSGTNIKTINNTTILGSGNIDTHELPSQSGQSGKFLTTNGTEVSWGSFDESDLVHKSGDETITGTKSFEATLQLKNNLSFRSYGSNDSGRLQFRAQPSDNVIRGTVAITDGYSTSGSGYTGFVAQMVARAGSTTSEPFNTMRVSNKGIEYIKEANDGTITGQYILIGSDGIVPQARLASGGTNGQVLTTNGTTMSWATISQMTATYDSTNERITWA